jgi:hypothetical protein
MLLELVCRMYCDQYIETYERDALVYEAFELAGNPLPVKGLHDSELADYLAEYGFPLCTDWTKER